MSDHRLARYKQDPLMHGTAIHQWISVITDDAEQILKMQHIFAYSGLPWGGGYCPVTYMFRKLSSS